MNFWYHFFLFHQIHIHIWTMSRWDDYALMNRLSLNTGKTQFIWFGTRNGLAKRDTNQLSNQSPSLVELTTVKNLGFTLDHELSMRDHVSKLCQSCYFQLRQIRTIRHSLSPSAIRTLVHAFICSRIDFSNSLLYGTSTYLLDRLQSVLNSSARLILKLGNTTRSQLQSDATFTGCQSKLVYVSRWTSSQEIVLWARLQSTWPSSAVLSTKSRRGATYDRRHKFSSWSLVFVRSVPVDVVFPSHPHNCGTYFQSTFELYTRSLICSERDWKLISCSSPFFTTEDLCHQCDIYYYWWGIKGPKVANNIPISDVKLIKHTTSSLACCESKN